MKLLVDENLSARVTSTLRDAGHDAVHVTAVGLANTDDDVILRSAADTGRIIVTADADFGAFAGAASRPPPLRADAAVF